MAIPFSRKHFSSELKKRKKKEKRKVTEIVTVETRFSSREMLSLPFMTAGTLTNDTANRHKYSARRKARRIVSHLFVSAVNLQQCITVTLNSTVGTQDFFNIS